MIPIPLLVLIMVVTLSIILVILFTRTGQKKAADSSWQRLEELISGSLGPRAMEEARTVIDSYIPELAKTGYMIKGRVLQIRYPCKPGGTEENFANVPLEVAWQNADNLSTVCANVVIITDEMSRLLDEIKTQ